jgi:hypothetical protein
VNTLEDTLVAALTETAAEIPPDHLPPLRLPARPARGPAWRPGRRAGGQFWTWLAPVTAAAAVAGVTTLSVVLAQQGGPAHPQPSAALGRGADALPPHYAALATQGKHGAARDRSSLVIRDTATGQTLATVDPPAPANSFCDLSGTPDGRTFVAEGCTVTETNEGGDLTITTSPVKFYQLTVDDQGKVSDPSPLPVPVPGGYDLDGLAISPDGSKLAVASTDRSHEPARNPAISLYRLGNGQLLRSWSWAGQGDIMGRSAGAAPLSWTADGTTIAFPLMLDHPVNHLAQDIVQIRLLDTTAPGSSLRGTRLVLNFGPTPSLQVSPLLSGPDSMITPDGSRIVASTAEVSGHPASTRLTVSEFSAATGAQAAVLDPVTVRGNSVLFRTVLWSSPDGSKLIVAGVPAGGLGLDRLLPVGVLTARGFTPLPGSLAGITLIAF